MDKTLLSKWTTKLPLTTQRVPEIQSSFYSGPSVVLSCFPAEKEDLITSYNPG